MNRALVMEMLLSSKDLKSVPDLQFCGNSRAGKAWLYDKDTVNHIYSRLLEKILHSLFCVQYSWLFCTEMWVMTVSEKGSLFLEKSFTIEKQEGRQDNHAIDGSPQEIVT